MLYQFVRNIKLWEMGNVHIHIPMWENLNLGNQFGGKYGEMVKGIDRCCGCVLK